MMVKVVKFIIYWYLQRLEMKNFDDLLLANGFLVLRFSWKRFLEFSTKFSSFLFLFVGVTV